MKLYAAIVAFIIAITAGLDHPWFVETLGNPGQLAGWMAGVLFGSFILYWFLRGARVIWERTRGRYAIRRVEAAVFALLALVLLTTAFIRGYIGGTAALGGAILLIVIFIILFFIFWRTLVGMVNRLRFGDAQYALTNLEFFPIVIIALAATIALGMSDQETFKGMETPALSFIIVALTYVFALILYWVYWAVKALIRWSIYRSQRFEYTEKSFIYHGSVRDLVLNWEDIKGVEVINADLGVGPLPPKPGFPSQAPGLVIYSKGRPRPDLIMDGDPHKLGQKITDEKARRA